MPNSSDIQSKAPPAVVIGIELPGFARRPVAEQFKQREQLHQRLTGALRHIAQKDRIVLDTGGGVAIVIFGQPSTALLVTCALCGTRSAEPSAIALRAGIAMGPVQAITGERGDIHIASDALDVAERIGALANSEKVVATRAFADALRRELPECGPALKSLGPVTDTQIRQHELCGIQITHPSILALRRKGSGRSKPLLGWLSLPRAAFACAAAALSIFLWSSLVGFGHAPKVSAVKVVVAPPNPIQVIEPATTPPPRENEHVIVVDMAKPEIAETIVSASTPSGQLGAPKSPLHHVRPRKGITVASAAPTTPSGTPVSDASIESRDVLPDHGGEQGKVLLAIAPWGEVLIDGKAVGISPPLTELELATGPHYVEVRNGASTPVLRRIEVQVNETLKIRHRFADSR